jgi:8-oxo-dGTP diphosphatase
MDRRYAGVIAQHDGAIALVRQKLDNGKLGWTIPSGAVEIDESPSGAAARELQEETGLIVRPAELALISTVTVHRKPLEAGHSWNYVAQVHRRQLVPTDPAEIADAAWFPLAEAIAELELLPYPPISLPAVAYLRGDTALRRWSFRNVSAQPADTAELPWSYEVG